MAPIMKFPKKAKVSSNIKRYVKKAIDGKIETKSIDLQSSYTPFNGIGGSGFDLQLINGVASGVQDFQRVGNTIKLTKMYFKFSTTFPDPTNIVRVMLVYDNAPNGLFPAGSDIFTFDTDPLRSFVLTDNSSRFRVLYDKYMSGGANGPTTKAVNLKTLSLKNREVRFLGNGANIADIQKGAIYLLMMSDSLATPHPRIDVMTRVFYKDA